MSAGAARWGGRPYPASEAQLKRRAEISERAGAPGGKELRQV